MINLKIFLKGLKSLKGSRSPAIPLAACFIALGALLKDAGFNIQQSAASSLLPSTRPSSYSRVASFRSFNYKYFYRCMASKLWTLSYDGFSFPLLDHKSQPNWKYYLSCHFLADTSWLIAKDGYKKINKKTRIDFGLE